MLSTNPRPALEKCLVNHVDNIIVRIVATSWGLPVDAPLDVWMDELEKRTYRDDKCIGPSSFKLAGNETTEENCLAQLTCNWHECGNLNEDDCRRSCLDVYQPEFCGYCPHTTIDTCGDMCVVLSVFIVLKSILAW